MNGRDVVVKVRDVETRFGAKQVHRGVSLDVYAGEVLAVVGGSGSGKSTLLREMVALQRPSAGVVSVFGRPLNWERGYDARWLRRRTGVLFQNGALFGNLTVAENVMVPLREHADLSALLMSEIAALKIALTGLEPESGALYPSQLSGGMRKRAALARALALDPDLLFLDEPSSGLDPISAEGFDELILDLQRALGLTVVLVTHDMDSLWRVADRVVLLGGGRLVADGTMRELALSTVPEVVEFFQGPRGRAARDQAWNRE